MIIKTPTLGSNFIWLVAEKVTALGLNFAIFTLLSRQLGVAGLGQYSYLIALVSLAIPLASIGMNGLVTREIVNRKKHQGVVLGTALSIRLAGCVLVVLFAIGLCQWVVEPKLRPAFYLLLSGALFTSLYVFDFWFQAHSLNNKAARCRLTALVIGACLKLLALYLEASVTIFIALAALDFLLLGTGYLFLFWWSNRAQPISLSASLSESMKLLAQGKWLFLSGVAAVVYLKVDQVMLGLLTTPTEVGIYAVAAKISEMWYFLPLAIVTVFFPKLLAHRANAPKQYSIMLQQVNDLLYTTALLMSGGIAVVGFFLIPIIFGKEYQPATQVLLIHVWGGVFLAMRELLSKWIIAENLLPVSLCSQLFGAFINILLNYFLIPLYGAVGAAIATLLSYICAGYLILWFYPKSHSMAAVISRSLVLPLRALRYRRDLYAPRHFYSSEEK